MNRKRLNRALYLEWKMAETPLNITLVCGLCSVLCLVADFMSGLCIMTQVIAIVYVFEMCCKKNTFREEAVFCGMVGRTAKEEILSKLLICTIAMASLLVFAAPMFSLFTANFDMFFFLGGGIFGRTAVEDYFPTVAFFVAHRLTLSIALAAFLVLAYYYVESSINVKRTWISIWVLIMLSPYIMEALGVNPAIFSNLLGGFELNPDMKYLMLMVADLILTGLFYRLAVRKAEKICG